MSENLKSGFVSLVGRPNVGKSTLMNLLVGEKISIITSKPQTTRNKIQSIYTSEDYQIIFIDTPGIHVPKHKLGVNMVAVAKKTLSEVDVVLFLTEPKYSALKADEDIISRLEKVNSPVFLILNKIDKIEKPEVLKFIDLYRSRFNFTEVIPISALTGENTSTLLDTIGKYLPYGPKYFPDDMITDQPEKQIVSEIIREKLLILMDEEIPHGIAVSIMMMRKRENKNLIDVEATIFCEKESHKGMVIGKNGANLKKVGTLARRDIENLLGSPVNLKLWVKVKDKWRNSDFLLKNFGYSSKDI